MMIYVMFMIPSNIIYMNRNLFKVSNNMPVTDWIDFEDYVHEIE